MADISMCGDFLCPAGKGCKRNEQSGTVPDRLMQSYTDFERRLDDEKCGAFWPLSQQYEYPGKS